MSQDQPPYRVAIAGCHRMLQRELAYHNFASAFNAVAETEVVAVFDYGEETRADFLSCWRDVWGEIPTYSDYDLMLREIQPDLLCVATRQTQHADQIEAAVEVGVRGILCDKPLATTLSEMDRILEACTDTPLVFGLDRRWNRRYKHLRENLADLLGTVTGLVAYGLPNTINHGCHWYDTMLALMGDPEPVWVSGLIDDSESDSPRRKMDPPARAQIGMDNTAVAYVSPDGKGPSFEVTGEEGRLSVFADATDAYLRREDGDRALALSLPSVDEDWPTGPAMVRDLVQAVENGTRSDCDLPEARRATEIGFAIHSSSAQNGAKISLPAADRSLRVESFPWGNE